MFKLTLADVKAKGLEAYKAGRLSAQGPTPACQYRDASGRACVVGAALPDELADSLGGLNFAVLQTLIDDNVVYVSDDEEYEIARLQVLHDRWANLVSGKVEPGSLCVFADDLDDLTAAEIEAVLVEELTRP